MRDFPFRSVPHSVGFCFPPLALLLAFMAFASDNAKAQWVATNGPYGGSVKCLLDKGAVTLAGTDGQGIFRSSDNGASWQAVNTGLVNLHVEALAWDGSFVLAGFRSQGVFRSSDNGSSWSVETTGLIGPGQSVFSLFATDTVVYAGTEGGVYRSTDHGDHWISWSNGLPGSTVNRIVSDGAYLYAALDGGTLYRSPDGGQIWNLAGTSGTPLYSVVVVDSILYLATGAGLYRSTDSGSNWLALGLTMPTWEITAIDTTLFASVALKGLYRSTDGGTQWERLDSLKHPSVLAFLVKHDTLYAGTQGSGVFRTTDQGITWQSVSYGMSALQTNGIAVLGNYVFAGTAGGGVFKSSDNGDTWVATDSGLTVPYVFSLVAIDSTLHVGAYKASFWSTDSGETWSAGSGMTTADVQAFTAGPSELYAAADNVYRSTDNGMTWTPVSNYHADRIVDGFAWKGDTLFTSVYSYGVYGTTDGGSTWFPSAEGPSYYDLQTLIQHEGALYAGSQSNGVFKSVTGTAWYAVNNGLTSPRVNTFLAKAHYLVAGTDLGVFRTYDEGGLWVSVNEGLGDLSVASLGGSADQLFAGTATGVYRRSWSEVVSVPEEHGQLPAEYSLEQSFPNPFNPETSIRFHLPEGVPVKLAVYDLLGREVSVLVERQLPAGEHTVRWNARGTASGVYVYRLETPSAVLVKKMLLVR